MRGWTLVAVGPLPPGLLARACAFLARSTGHPAEEHPDRLELGHAYDPARAQHDCRRLLPPLETLAGERDRLVLGLTDVDLYSAIFTFVFGEARLHGPAGIVSLHRLRPELYGLPDDPELFEARMRREVLHEAGHLLGLVHCDDIDCAMHFSGVVEEIDLKQDTFCESCRESSGIARAGG